MNDYGYMMDETLQFLSVGMGCLPEKQMDRLGPLPKELRHADREIRRLSCLETMDRTAKSLDQWLKAGMEENRFGMPYVQIGKMILDAVTTMGRGLVTLRVLGEDLSRAPMQIGDLLDIASFHFDKCAQGVAHSAGVNMTVCTRLFASQLRWQNLIFRLYRTEEFLSKPYHAEKKSEKTGQSLPAPETASGEPAPGALRPEQMLKPFPTAGAPETDNTLSGEDQTISARNKVIEADYAEILPVPTAARSEEKETPEMPAVFEAAGSHPGKRRRDPIAEAFAGWEWDGVPYPSDALIERKYAEIKAWMKTDPPGVWVPNAPPRDRDMNPIPIFEEAETF